MAKPVNGQTCGLKICTAKSIKSEGHSVGEMAANISLPANRARRNDQSQFCSVLLAQEEVNVILCC
jgi:hypothetical protein